MKKESKAGTASYSTDYLMKQLWYNLVEDFKSTNGSTFALGAQKALNSSVKDFRDYVWPTKSTVPAHMFKCLYQLESLFKRYRFADDKYTTDELEDMTKIKFMATQYRVASTPIVMTPFLRAVVTRARSINRKILGRYDVDEHIASCKFGKRASVGVPARASYLDSRLASPLSGSLEHTEWMQNICLPQDSHLSGILSAHGPLTSSSSWDVCTSLTNTNVPKSWKSLRGIMPNTTCGSFYTAGLGMVLQNRLRNAGLNLTILQGRHKRLARKYSENQIGVTADLSAASDSFSSDIVNMLLPREWFRAVSYGRIDNLKLGKETCYMASFMGMGIGFTFPLQTLVFYSIIRAVRELSGCEGVTSVYGDDLIYPKAIHPMVEYVLKKLRFILNVDKTFVNDAFRESCGGDFYRGIDVRPFQPEGSAQQLNRMLYLALLYKVYNGLRRRWSKWEIPRTLKFLTICMMGITPSIHQVPLSYPDFSGVQVKTPRTGWLIPWSPVKFSKKDSCLTFKHLQQMSDKRIVIRHDAYLWDKLRALQTLEPLSAYECSQGYLYDRRIDLKDLNTTFVSSIRIAPKEVFTWIDDPSCKKVYSVIQGKRILRMCATVALKGPQRLNSVLGATSSWSLGAPYQEFDI